LQRHSNRRILITGAANGIGRATAAFFAREGAKLCLLDLPDTGIAEVAREFGDPATIMSFEASVTEETAVEAAVEAMVQRFGGIDAVVNSAGVVAVEPALEVAADDFRRVIDINLVGTWLVCKAAASRMMSQGGGAIVNISSVYGFQGAPKRTAYCASKGAVISLTDSLAVEWGKLGIRVNSVAPTGTRTPMVRDLIDRGIYDLDGVSRKTPLGRLAEPEEVAAACGYLVSDDAAMVTGHHLRIDGGWLANGYPT
tara:strand:+ start:6231 stop:6995 length:765 start_codon:yes stop_codon:yes gene_type:complete